MLCDLLLFIDSMVIFNSNKPIYIDLHKSIIKYFHFLAKKSEQKLELADIKNGFTFKEVCNNWFGYALEGNKGSSLDIEFGKFLYNFGHYHDYRKVIELMVNYGIIKKFVI